MRAECKKQGLVYDTKTKKCREKVLITNIVTANPRLSKFKKIIDRNKKTLDKAYKLFSKSPDSYTETNYNALIEAFDDFNEQMNDLMGIM